MTSLVSLLFISVIHTQIYIFSLHLYDVALLNFLCHLDGDGEKAQFLQKLAKLRKQSSVFLRMLNDMRRRLKELPPDATAAKSYK